MEGGKVKRVEEKRRKEIGGRMMNLRDRLERKKSIK